MKGTVVAIIVVAVAILGLIVRWYPVATSQQVAQTVTYTTSVPTSYATTSSVATVGYMTQIDYSLPLGQPHTIYTLASPVTFSSKYVNWTSPSFYLQSGMAFRLTAVLCEDCFIAMMPQSGFLNESLTWDFNINPPQLGMNNYTVIGLVTNSGKYVIFLHNSELTGTVTSLSVSEMTASLLTMSATSQVMQAVTAFTTINSTIYSTSNSTAYLQSMNSPYTVLGSAAAAAIIIIVVIMAAFIVAIDRGLISVSSKHGRRTRSSKRRAQSKKTK